MLGIEILLMVGCFIQVTCADPPPIKMQLPSGLLGVKDGEAIDIVDARLDKLNGTVCELGERMKALQVDTQQAIGSVAQTEASTTQLKTSHDELENEVVELSATVTTTQKEVLKLKELFTGIQNKQGDLERKTDQATEDLSGLNQVATQVADIEKTLREEREKNKFIENSMTQLQATVTALTTEVSCPTSVGYVSNSAPKLCYKRYAMAVSYDDAVKTCEGDNALLISLDTNEKLHHIIDYLNSLGASAYNQGLNRYQLFIGLLRENGGEFKWANGETGIPRWAPGEPSAPTSRDCGQLLEGGIGDVWCTPDFTGKQPFICEISQED